jgi:integrase
VAPENDRKFGPEGSRRRPEDAPRGAHAPAEASEKAARRSSGDAPAEVATLGAGLRSAAPQAPGPSDPTRRSSPDPGNRAEASATDASASAAAGAPSAAPPFPARGLHDGLISLPGAGPDRPANRLEDIPDQAQGASGASEREAPEAPGPGASPWLAARRGHAAALSAPVVATRVGADGCHAPADAGSQPDPKRGPHGGVRDGAEDRKPEGAALETQAPGANRPALLPSAGRLSGRLAALAETAKAYARAAQADNTQRAYSADWRQFASWLRRQGLAETPPDPEAVGLYLASQVERGGAELSVATLERRLSGIAWRYRQLGEPLDIRDRHIATVLAGIRRRHARPPTQKAAIFADELLAMLATLDMDLRGLRDRAILAIGFAGGLRRSEIVGLDCGPDQNEDGSGWIEIFPEGALLTIRGKTGWRDVEIGRGSRADTCPVALLETWLRLGRISHGPLFRAIARKNGGVSGARLTDKHVVRLVKTCALAAGLRGDLTEGERRLAFGGHSLRAGLASSAQIEEAHVQRHLGHASAEMTRRYQRKRDRFTINLTRAAGL